MYSEGRHYVLSISNYIFVPIPLFLFRFPLYFRKLIIWVDRPLPLWALQVSFTELLLNPFSLQPCLEVRSALF